jgi:small GTP-binding protein
MSYSQSLDQYLNQNKIRADKNIQIRFSATKTNETNIFTHNNCCCYNDNKRRHTTIMTTEEEKKQQQRVINIITLGDNGIGKTSLLTRLLNDEEIPFTEQYTPTVNYDSYTTELCCNQQLISVRFHDIPCIRNMTVINDDLLRQVVQPHVCIVAFSVDSNHSFESVKRYVKLVKHLQIPIVLVGLKCDITERSVSKETGESLMRELRLNAYFECSNKNDSSVQQIFQFCIKSLVANTKQVISKKKKRNSISLKKKKASACKTM